MVSEPVKVESENKFEISDTEFDGKGLPLAVSCVGTSGGELKAAGVGVISTFSVTRCEPAKVGESEINICESVETVEARDMPWKMELYKEGSEDRAKIGGEGTPAWDFKCKTILGSHVDECDINTSTRMTDASGGVVEAAFDTKSNKTHCSGSKGEAGEWKGTLKIKATSKEVEAIKVE